MSSAPRFSFSQANIENYFTKQSYILRRMMDIEPTEAFLNSIVAACNEQHIYEWLFQTRLQGKAYPKSDAIWFHNWGSDGWKNNTHFLFIVTDYEGKAVAAADIKTADTDAAEIGYWSSIHHRGIMTNATKVMIAEGFKAGFKSFYAKVKPDNEASVAVLKRLNFRESPKYTDNEFKAFEISIDAKSDQ